MHKIQYRDLKTGETRTMETADEKLVLATAKAALAQGEPTMVELRVRTSVDTRFGTEWADVTRLVRTAIAFMD